MYGKENGVNGYYKVAGLKSDIPFLPEILHNNGYFTSRGLINDKILSSRGFDIREEYNEYKEDLNEEHPNLIKKTFEEANGAPFFTFLQFTRIHTVTVTEVLKKYEWDDRKFYENKKNNLQLYDNVFKETGIYAKKIFDTVKELGILENTIIIFFADHGTGVGERFGERNYGSFTYEETIRTFYHFVGEKIKMNKSSNALLATIDIFPTVLELCNIKIPNECKGKSILKFLTGDAQNIENNQYTFSETGALHGPYPSPEESNIFCIKNTNFKLIYNRDKDEWEFYHLVNDPNELKNISGTGIEIEKEFQKELLRWIDR
tara:strand:- start:1503 stop:2456 length:954 start_codon:yes stop_codon:yes gene_type:complete